MHVLFLYASTGSGHYKAASYVMQALGQKNANLRLSKADVLNLCQFSTESLILKGFRLLISRLPNIYRILYRLTENNALFNFISGLLFSGSIKKLISLCRKTDVTSIVCTHPFALLFASRLKKRLGAHSPVTMGIITDYRIHRFWLYRSIDMYFVPNMEMKKELLNLGWKDDKVYVTGIPHPVDIKRAKTVNENKHPFLLIAGGGWGLGNLEETTEKLLDIQNEFRLIIVTGKNVSLYRRLKELEKLYTGKLTVEGTIPNLYTVMKDAAAVITKPGGLTVTEAMILNKPLILLKPLPGAEERNYKFLIESNAAVSFQTFLQNPEIIRCWKEQYSKNQELIAQVNSSRNIAEQILKTGG